MFQLTTANGQNMAIPDTCLTPSPGGPVPMPYPNTSMTSSTEPDTISLKILVDGTPTLNLKSVIPLSNGDEAGSNMGVVSGELMGQTSYVDGSEILMLDGDPAVRLTNETGHNGSSMNAEGACIDPSQTLMIVNS